MSADRSAHFDELAPRWDDMAGADAIRRARMWCVSIPLPDEALVLDIGCGTGVSSQALAQRLPEGLVIAADTSTGMLCEGRRRRGHRRVRWLCADGGVVPLADCSLDAIVALHVWPHLDDQESALAEWRRVLKPGGMLWIVHLSSRQKVNAIHRASSGTVRRDRLPPAEVTASTVERCGFCVAQTQDDDEGYVVCAVRP